MSDEFIYCPRCRGPLSDSRESGHLHRQCGRCGFIHYRNPAPAVGVLIIDGGAVLLVKRRFDPYRGKWSIPSGFIEYDEDVRDTAVRELQEETGLTVELDALHTVESCFDDPRGNTVLVLYRGHVSGGVLIAGDDADDARFFAFDGLPEIAFEAHRKVLQELSRSGA